MKNLIVLMSDEHDPRVMGAAGHYCVQTPNLDRLARAGMHFTNAYTPSPICVPARAAFATGLRVHQTGCWDNAMPYSGDPPGWAHVLRQHGVRVESIGKLHYRSEDDDNGFDAEHVPMHVSGSVGQVWGSIRDPYLKNARKSRLLGDYIGPGESPYTEYDRSVASLAVDWIRDHARQGPFVLYVGFVAPHFPLVAPRKFFDLYPLSSIREPKLHPKTGHVNHPWIKEYEDFGGHEHLFKSPEERLAAIAAYFGLCSFLDSNIGEILQAVEAAGLSDTTQVVYTSDHGDNLGARGLWAKSTLYEESVRVPMIVAGGGMASGTCETPVDLLDLYPTILQSAGIDPAAHMRDRVGMPLQAIAAAPYDPQRAVFSEYHAAGSNTAAYMLRKGRWKYVHYVRFEPELFDLDADPEETTNLAGDPAHAGVVAELARTLASICDPEATDLLAKRDQMAMIDRYGGVEAASSMGPRGATPAPRL